MVSKENRVFDIIFIITLLILIPGTLHPMDTDSVIYVRSIDSITLDPGIVRDIYSEEVVSNIFEGLVCFGVNPLTIRPCLAEKWETHENGKRWIFHLRQGVRFHNGEEFNAGAVLNTFQYRKERAAETYHKWNYLFPYLKKIRVLKPYQLEITLEQFNASFLAALADPTAYIIAPQAIRTSPYTPVGTGAFKFTKWKEGDYLIIEKNDDYWGGEIHISKVVFKTIPNSSSRVLQLKNGNADLMLIKSSREYEEFLGKKNFSSKMITLPRVHYLAFNTRKPIFSKLEVRLAFSHLINKRALIKHNFQDLAQPAITPIPPNILGFNANIRDPKYDLEAARNLLKKAGLSGGFTCNLYFTETNVALQRIADHIIESAKELSIKVEKKPLPYPELAERISRGEHDMVILGWLGGADPDLFLYPLFTMTNGNTNRAFYSNRELTRLLDKSRKTLLPAERKKYIEKAQEIIHRERPWIPLYHLRQLALYNKRIKNLEFNPFGVLLFKNVVKTE